jgi:hypothetical protein
MNIFINRKQLRNLHGMPPQNTNATFAGGAYDMCL